MKEVNDFNLQKYLQWSGLASIIGGILFVLSVITLPPRGSTGSYSPNYLLIAGAMTFMLLGLFGMYIRQLEEIGVDGLVGFVLAFVGSVWLFGMTILNGFLWPIFGAPNPYTVSDFDLEIIVFALISMLFVLGYFIFGLFTMKAGILPRYGALLLAIGPLFYYLGAGLFVVTLIEVLGNQTVGTSAFNFGPANLVTSILEISGALLTGAGHSWLGYGLWSSSDGKGI